MPVATFHLAHLKATAQQKLTEKVRMNLSSLPWVVVCVLVPCSSTVLEFCIIWAVEAVAEKKKPTSINTIKTLTTSLTAKISCSTNYPSVMKHAFVPLSQTKTP